jgi:hypothetical protein
MQSDLYLSVGSHQQKKGAGVGKVSFSTLKALLISN